MKELILRIRMAAIFAMAGLAIFLAAGCASTKVVILAPEMAEERTKEPLLLLPPVASRPELLSTASALGKYLNVEVPKRVSGTVTYGGNIDSLKNIATWNNLIKNGSLNASEMAAIGKTVGCNSVLGCQILELNPYPPFRMVNQYLWVDSETGNVIARLYHDINLADSETNYRFKNYAGQGPAKQLYEAFFYSEDLYQTAYLMPEEFNRFSAAFSAAVLFEEARKIPWWLFWRSF
ncbi:MAG: hypothetical protein A2X49_09640 [Lentisphaerae bacterium GWF2_52_8]|nr:MAG: hypothetical protein A2X49_09640 [Lentisphaerae bacterium GWF2_52_8]